MFSFDFDRFAALGGTQVDLDRFIADLETRKSASARFPIWMTLEIGTCKSLDELTRAIETSGFRIGDWARQILKKTPLSPERKTLNLVRVTGRQLGFDRNATRKEIYERALSLGLRLSPAEVGPQLRCVYLDQPVGECFRIAMEPIEDSDRGLNVFDVGHGNGGRWVSASYGRPDDEWSPEGGWVFVLP